LPPGGVRGSLRGLVWLVGLIVYLFMLAVAFQLTTSRSVGISTLRIVLTEVASVGLWWLTPFLLLCGRVRLRALVLTALISSTLLVVAGKVSTVVMPRIVGSNERKYGTIGAVFAIQSWLVVMACIVVGGALLGALATESEGWIGTWARGSADLESWHRVPTGIFARGRVGRSAIEALDALERPADRSAPADPPSTPTESTRRSGL
jgi:membrane protein